MKSQGGVKERESFVSVTKALNRELHLLRCCLSSRTDDGRDVLSHPLLQAAGVGELNLLL